ncbi:MAG: hypothetical protein GY749_00440 [Desulfobacteraceae bacterium]|nr:hypothetical protein [Desulfobacteraceae bacterium]
MKLTKINGPDGSELFIQYDEEECGDLRSVGFIEDIAERTNKFKETMANTIQSYSSLVLNSVKSGISDVPAPESVQIEFGLQLGGEAGIPFVTKGSAQSNIKITMNWNLKDLKER